MKNIKLGTSAWMGISFVVLAGLLIWASDATKKNKIKKEDAMTTREVAFLCTTDMATQFHIHPELKILINGKYVEIPANIGINPTCMNSIHTHDTTGIIHVESPISKDFTIGDFFAVWGKDFSKDKILDSVATRASQIVITVNGQKVETYENTILRDKDKIVISYKK